MISMKYFHVYEYTIKNEIISVKDHFQNMVIMTCSVILDCSVLINMDKHIVGYTNKVPDGTPSTHPYI